MMQGDGCRRDMAAAGCSTPYSRVVFWRGAYFGVHYEVRGGAIDGKRD
jgi:hypothetical protein